MATPFENYKTELGHFVDSCSPEYAVQALARRMHLALVSFRKVPAELNASIYVSFFLQDTVLGLTIARQRQKEKVTSEDDDFVIGVFKDVVAPRLHSDKTPNISAVAAFVKKWSCPYVAPGPCEDLGPDTWWETLNDWPEIHQEVQDLDGEQGWGSDGGAMDEDQPMGEDAERGDTSDEEDFGAKRKRAGSDSSSLRRRSRRAKKPRVLDAPHALTSPSRRQVPLPPAAQQKGRAGRQAALPPAAQREERPGRQAVPPSAAQREEIPGRQAAPPAAAQREERPGRQAAAPAGAPREGRASSQSSMRRRKPKRYVRYVGSMQTTAKSIPYWKLRPTGKKPVLAKTGQKALRTDHPLNPETCTECGRSMSFCLWGVKPYDVCIRCAVNNLDCSVQGKFEPLDVTWWTDALTTEEKQRGISPKIRLNKWNARPRPEKPQKWRVDDEDGYETEYGPNNKPAPRAVRYSTNFFVRRLNEGEIDPACTELEDDADDERSVHSFDDEGRAELAGVFGQSAQGDSNFADEDANMLEDDGAMGVDEGQAGPSNTKGKGVDRSYTEPEAAPTAFDEIKKMVDSHIDTSMNAKIDTFEQRVVDLITKHSDAYLGVLSEVRTEARSRFQETQGKLNDLIVQAKEMAIERTEQFSLAATASSAAGTPSSTPAVEQAQAGPSSRKQPAQGRSNARRVTKKK